MVEEMDHYFKELRLKVAETTFARKAYEVKAFCSYLSKINKQIVTVNRQDVEKYLLTVSISRQARQAKCCSIREFFEFLKIEPNPTKGIKFLPDKGRRLIHLPSKLEIEKALVRVSRSETFAGLRNKLMVELAYGSGLRRTELARLNMDDIDLDSRSVSVTGKGGKERVVPLTEKAIETIRECFLHRPVVRGPLFVSYMGRRIKPSSLYYIMRDSSGIRPHLWRHACATHMLQGGCNLRIIQELLGHNRLTTTQVYTHISKEELRCKIQSTHPRSRV
jgi:integrase/recombinase XerC